MHLHVNVNMQVLRVLQHTLTQDLLRQIPRGVIKCHRICDRRFSERLSTSTTTVVSDLIRTISVVNLNGSFVFTVFPCPLNQFDLPSS